MSSTEWIKVIVAPLMSAAIGGGSAYLGIRVDIAQLNARVSSLESETAQIQHVNDNTTERIDRILQK